MSAPVPHRCRGLCDGQPCRATELIDAHIVPRGFARVFKGSGANISLSSYKIGPTSAPLGEFDGTILCETCDRQLGKFDEYAIGISRDFAKKHRQVGENGFEIDDFDGMSYSKFVLAVLWRASISNRPKLKHFSLGKHENVIRDVIFGASEIAHNASLKIVIRRLKSGRFPDIDHFYTLPFQTAFAGKYASYQFSVGGFSISTILDSRPMSAELSPMIFASSHSLRGEFQTLEDTGEFKAMTTSVVREAIRRGKPPHELKAGRRR